MRALSLPSAILTAAPGAARAETYLAPLDVRTAGEARLTVQPKAKAIGGKVEITLTASAANDAEVAIVNPRGRAVRHLASGLPIP